MCLIISCKHVYDTCKRSENTAAGKCFHYSLTTAGKMFYRLTAKYQHAHLSRAKRENTEV